MMAIGLLSAGISAMGTMMSAQAASDAAAYRAAVGQQLAKQALQTGERQAYDVQQKGGATVGAMRAAAGASGLDVFGESAGQVQESALQLSKLDEATTKHNAALKAWAYKAEASAAAAEADNAKLAGWLGATSQLIGGFKSALGGAQQTGNNFSMWQTSSPVSGGTNWNLFSTQNTGDMGYW